jgi:hypothetical protein
MVNLALLNRQHRAGSELVQVRTWLKLLLGALGAIVVLGSDAEALVQYDGDRLFIDGVQLLQTVENPNAYEYLANDLAVARDAAGDYQLLMAKHVGGDGASGGILHALVEFALRPERRAEIERKLQEQRPGAVLVGPVNMIALDDGHGSDGRGSGSFQVISAILTAGEGAGDHIRGRVVHSGTAPFAPGSKAAVAARLSPEAATLMWNSLTGATSDLSIAVRGYYEAQIEGYNAIVRADVSTIYNHQSFVDSFQKRFTKRQVRDIADKLVHSQVVSVEVFDRSVGVGIKVDDMAKIVDVLTDKLIELLFDRQAGWAKLPESVTAVERDQICNRQTRGFFSRLFRGATDDHYCTDDQYVIKDISNVLTRSFVLNLSKKTTIKAPFDTAGNLGGFYQDLEVAERDRYFKVISLDDPAFEEVDVAFYLDSAIVEAFTDKLTLVSVNVRHKRVDGSIRDMPLVFDRDGVKAQKVIQHVKLRRLGDPGESWREFKYQVAWNVRGDAQPLRVPPNADEFIASREAGIQLTPPLDRQTLVLDVDNSSFAARGILAVVVKLGSKINGKLHLVEHTIRAGDAEGLRNISILKDPGGGVAIATTWHTRGGDFNERPKVVDHSYHFVAIPSAEWFARGGDR